MLLIRLLQFYFRVLEKYYVGTLVDNELPVFPSPRLVHLYKEVSLTCELHKHMSILAGVQLCVSSIAN